MNDSDTRHVVGGFLVLAIILAISGWLWGVKCGMDWQREMTFKKAVLDGIGEWKPNAKGEPEFEWILPKKDKN